MKWHINAEITTQTLQLTENFSKISKKQEEKTKIRLIKLFDLAFVVRGSCLAKCYLFCWPYCECPTLCSRVSYSECLTAHSIRWYKGQNSTET